MDLAKYRDRGLYDPSAPDAAEQRDLLEHLAARGVTIDQMLLAQSEDRLPFVLGDLLIRTGEPELTIEQVAARASMTTATVARLWRAAGLPEPEAGTRHFTEADASLLELMGFAISAFGEPAAVQLMRVMGSSMARVAEAGFAASIVNVRDGWITRAESLVAAADAAEMLGTMTQSAAQIFDVLFRRHIEATARRWSTNPSDDPATLDAAIGFVDLAGFTAVSRELDTGALGEAVNDLEELAIAAALALDGRVVKMIGDEIMFMARDARSACALALRLVDAIAAHPVLPAARAAVAAGPVIARDGDYFGPVVNLASRLVEQARAGELLVPLLTAAALDAEHVHVSSPISLSLKSFAEPVSAVSVTRRV